MLKIKVRYFLNDQGLKYFMQWYEEVSAITSQQDGFIKISCENNVKNPVIYLHFENEEKLTAWASTIIHDNLSSRIETYFLEPEEVVIEDTGNDLQ